MYIVDNSKVTTKNISKREAPKVRQIIEGLKSLNDCYPDTNEGDLLGQMKQLILEYYGREPTVTELKRNLELAGVGIDRDTLSKYLRRGFP